MVKEEEEKRRKRMRAGERKGEKKREDSREENRRARGEDIWRKLRGGEIELAGIERKGRQRTW